MKIKSQKIDGNRFSWTLRCPARQDAAELSALRGKIDAQTENLDREPGEGVLSPEDFEAVIEEDTAAEKTLFLVAEVNGKIVGFTRCEGKKLRRFRHKAEFGICILQEFCGCGIGRVLLEHVLAWADQAGLEKIMLTVVETNTAAIRLYKRFGFVEEGLLRKDRIHKDGIYYDTIIMGRCRESI